jgi:hypothetical protein
MRPGMAQLRILASMSLSACCGDSVSEINYRVVTVYGIPGDTISTRASAIASGWPGCLLYTSESNSQAFRWTVSDSTVASVNSTGLITTQNPGEATLTATAGGFTARYGVSVYTSPVFSSLRLKVSEPQVSVGDTAFVTIDALDAAGGTISGVYVALLVERLRDSIVVPLDRIHNPKTPVTMRFVGYRPGPFLFRTWEMRSSTLREPQHRDSIGGSVVP